MQKLTDSVLYSAFKRKDPNFDGRFFVGVSSTGIYCRPVCKAKQPKPENCTFYGTAAEAEQAGFRPCLLCKPELAPGKAPVDAKSSLAYRAARFIDENCANVSGVEEIADNMGCSDRHLRRAFITEFNVSPARYLQTCRLLLAKNLLTSTNLSVIEIAMTAGFGSLRCFNDLFNKRYKLAPTGLRRQVMNSKVKNDNIKLSLGYRPPYNWQQLLDFLSLRAIPGVEVVKDGEYLRTAYFRVHDEQDVYGCVRVGNNPQNNTLVVTIEASLLPALPQVLARVRRLFDLYCDPDSVFDTLKSMNNIKSGLCTRGTRLPGSFNTFEMAVRAILGQQITVKAARTLAARLVETYGTPIKTEIEGLTHTFPQPKDLISTGDALVNRLGQLGIIGTRTKAIIELALAFINNEIDFNFSIDAEQEIKKLVSIPGIGSWTAHYIAMRAMGWPDAFLEADVGIKKALAPRTVKEISALAENWRPWRSYAVINLWNSL